MRVPFLANLGITDIEQARSPTAKDFPRAFNINNRLVWESVISQLVETDDPQMDWGIAIKEYVKSCIESDRYPFSNLKQSSNDQILVSLQDARRAIVRFMNQSKLLTHISIRTTRREVLMNGVGFTVSVFGNVQIKDPTFPKWLMQTPYPGFRIKHEGKYLKHLGHDVTMIVYNEGANGSQRWHIGYEILCRHFPDLPGQHLPSKDQMERFILDVIWMPILKANRPQGYHRRLI